MSDGKRQKVVHLSAVEQCRQRPDMYIGSVTETAMTLPTWSEDERTKSVVLRPGLLSLMNELVTNALDNQRRPGGMTYISLKWDGAALTVENDGATLSVVHTVEGQPELLVAFGWMHSGTNFDQTDTGKKANKFTAGRNGVGGKACLVFCASYEVTASNAEEGKERTVAWREGYLSTPALSAVKAYKGAKNRTRVVWRPDLSVLGTADGALPEGMDVVASWLAHNASLCADAGVVVKYNGKQLRARTPEQFCKLLGGTAPLAACTVTDADGVEVLRLCVGARVVPLAEPEPGLAYAFVNATPCPHGTHETMILRKVCETLDEIAKRRRTGGVVVHVTPTFLRKHAVVVAVVLVDNERFTDQTKRTLDTPVKDYGWKWGAVSDAFASALGRAPFIDRALESARQRELADASRATKHTKRVVAPADSKYEPATAKGRPQSTLIVCEGDSAANLVRSGLSVVGRTHYGLYPLRGKFLNVRGATPKDVLENKEAMALLRILGIQLGVTYDDAMARKLPYQRLMVMSDQDVDGSHIAGLVYNFVDVVAPSLLAVRPRFMYRFATALIRVTVDRAQLGFYSQTEYDDWVADRRAHGQGVGTCKYFKGLGTSSAALAKEYFRHLAEHVVVVVHRGAESSHSLDLAFNKKRSDDRKAFLTACDPRAFVDYKQAETTVDAFVTSELLPQYALASVVRAIPSVVDGFKEALRKCFHGARILKIPSGGISVANAAGEIASKTKYHHRATALEDTLIGMAADYAGTPNVNLFLPLGQFGTRFKHAAASAAYPLIALNAPLEGLLYPTADAPVLVHAVDEGHPVEPKTYVPVVAMALVQGARGIATGWSTDVPQFHPLDVVEATRALLDERPLPALTPWYRGFTGPVVPDGEGQFTVSGVVEWHGDDLHVVEVPPFREVEAYKDDWIKAGLTEREIQVGERGTDEVVHFVLVGCTASRTETLRQLGLVKRVGFHNMHLLDARGVLTKYAAPEEVLRAHAPVRMRTYERRLAHQVDACARDLAVTEAKMTFVTHVLDGTFVMRTFPNAHDAGEGCRALGLPEHPTDGGYHYLLSMSQVSLVADNVERFRRTAADARDELERLRALTPHHVWHQELTALEEALARDPRYAKA
jgi:DNA topoisomerase-2